MGLTGEGGGALVATRKFSIKQLHLESRTPTADLSSFFSAAPKYSITLGHRYLLCSTLMGPRFVSGPEKKRAHLFKVEVCCARIVPTTTRELSGKNAEYFSFVLPIIGLTFSITIGRFVKARQSIAIQSAAERRRKVAFNATRCSAVSFCSANVSHSASADFCFSLIDTATKYPPDGVDRN